MRGLLDEESLCDFCLLDVFRHVGSKETLTLILTKVWLLTELHWQTTYIISNNNNHTRVMQIIKGASLRSQRCIHIELQ